MPAYFSDQAVPLAKGVAQVISSSTLTANPYKTQAVRLGTDVAAVTVFNYSTVNAAVQVSWEDLEEFYLQLQDGDTSFTVVVPPSSALRFKVTAPFLRLAMASDPGAANLVVQA